MNYLAKMVNCKTKKVIYTLLLCVLLRDMLFKPICDAKRRNLSELIRYRLKKIMYEPYLDQMYKMFLPASCKKENNCFHRLMKLLRVHLKLPGKKVRMKLRLG